MTLSKNERRTSLRDHRPHPVPRSYKRVPIKMSDTAEVTVVVRSKGSNAEWDELVARSISGLPRQREYVTRAAFGKSWGASPADLAAVSAFGKAYNLTTVSSEEWRRCVVLSGTIANLQKAFGVEFQGVEHPLGRFRTYRGRPQVDASIDSIVEAVLGLDNIPTSKAHLPPPAGRGPSELNLGELRQSYSFPPHFRGKGQCVAVIELGGGIYRSDYNEYFKRIGLTPPRLRIRTIGNASNHPAPRADIREAQEAMFAGTYPPDMTDELLAAVAWTSEATMDVEIVGTLAPEATILLLFTEGDDQGKYHAITSILADARNAPSVISCSWSDPDSPLTPLMPVLNRWFQAAAVLGVTVCFSSGDNGDGTLGETGQLTFTTTFPSSSPYILSCGATTLDVKTGMEIAWRQNIGELIASGGGFSYVFDRPPWQISAGINSRDWIKPGATSGTGRGVPDVSAKGNLEPAFCYLVAGMLAMAGGTSESAPLWAALIAVLNQGLNCPVGSINRLLYEGGLNESLRDITKGNTGHLRAKVGWDPSTGWGSPHGEALLDALSGHIP